ncbi:MAG: hypothetical protein WCO78_01590 [Candidatus Roizmanbacteria bacterium]
MKHVLHYFGIGLIAVGTAAVVFWLLLSWSQKAEFLTPVPQENPLQIIYPTP